MDESRSSWFSPRALLAVPPLNRLLQQDQIACVAAVVHHVRQQMQARKDELPQKMWITFGLPGKIIDGSKIEKLAAQHQKSSPQETQQRNDLIAYLATHHNNSGFWSYFQDKQK